MTRKDYVLLAEVIHNNIRLSLQNGEEIDALKCVAYDLANRFVADNPNFNRHRFYSACGVYQEDLDFLRRELEGAN